MADARREMVDKLKAMMTFSDEQAERARSVVKEYEDRALDELKGIAGLVSSVSAGGGIDHQAILIVGEIRGRLRSLIQAQQVLTVYEEGQRQLREAKRAAGMLDE